MAGGGPPPLETKLEGRMSVSLSIDRKAAHSAPVGSPISASVVRGVTPSLSVQIGIGQASVVESHLGAERDLVGSEVGR